MCGKQDVDEANTCIWILTPSGKAEKKAVLITIRTVHVGHSHAASEPGRSLGRRLSYI